MAEEAAKAKLEPEDQGKDKAAAGPEKRHDPTDAVAPEGMEDAPAVEINGVTCDLDDLELPKEVEESAFTSGGYPYGDKMSSKEYDAALLPLQIELLKLQSWARKRGERIAIVLEGRDGAGKGGTIKTITEHLNPRSVKIVALSKPSPAEAGQWYFQRYLAHMPSAGEITLFDRSWYNRAVVERVMDFATEDQAVKFLAEAPRVEELLVGDGVRLFKFWLTVGREMQLKRLHDRRHDPLKRWKLSPIDYAGLGLWDAYSDAAERMLRLTHTAAAPWTVVKANDKKRLRLGVIRKILLSIPYDGRDLAAIGEVDGRIVIDAPAFLAEGGES
jgi:polyphosphate kinase 2